MSSGGGNPAGRVQLRYRCADGGYWFRSPSTLRSFISLGGQGWRSGGQLAGGLTVRDRPDVRYAHNGDVAIAYQVFGQGPIDLVCVPGFVSNLYWSWELPEYNRMLTRLGSFARVV